LEDFLFQRLKLLFFAFTRSKSTFFPFIFYKNISIYIFIYYCFFIFSLNWIFTLVTGKADWIRAAVIFSHKTEIFFVIVFFNSIFYSFKFLFSWAFRFFIYNIYGYPQLFFRSDTSYSLKNRKVSYRRFSLFQDGACLWITFFDIINISEKAPHAAAFSIVYHNCCQRKSYK